MSNLAMVALSPQLFRRLEYYRNFIPYCVDLSEAEYADTVEGKATDALLAQYIAMTGVVPERKPS